MRPLINIQGSWYLLLGMYGGRCYLGKLFDLDNEVAKTGMLYDMQPFFYESEVWYGPILNVIVKGCRAIIKLCYVIKK